MARVRVGIGEGDPTPYTEESVNVQKYFYNHISYVLSSICANFGHMWTSRYDSVNLMNN